MENRFNLIISDNPISRAYLNFFKKKTEYINEIIYLNFPSFIFFSNILKANINFKRNNYHAIKLLKNSKVKELIEEIEKFFDFYPGFISEMYNFKNLLLFKKKLKYINSISINSDLLYKKLNSTEDIYINTGNEIIKKPLKKNIKILHIHPGYLPNVKGADSSFHMIDNFNILGVSSFLVNKKIDEGEILFRENIAIPQFKFKYKNSFCLKDKYRIWYAFVDPLIRTYHLRKIIFNISSKKIPKLDIRNNQSQYFSFANEKIQKKIFNIVFK